MTNTVNIPERTLAQISDASDSINVVGGVGGRLSVYQPLVCRITDHRDDSGATGDEVDTMAIFKSQRHGEPWLKDANVLEHIIHEPSGVAPDNVSVLYPDFDYATFQ